MKLNTIVLSAFLACGVCACATSGPSRYHETRVTRVSGVDVIVRPPAPKVVVVPSARAGYVWAPGYWRWNGHRYFWVPGYWVPARHGYRWVPSHWSPYGPRWRYVPGYWAH